MPNSANRSKDQSKIEQPKRKTTQPATDKQEASHTKGGSTSKGNKGGSGKSAR